MENNVNSRTVSKNFRIICVVCSGFIYCFIVNKIDKGYNRTDLEETLFVFFNLAVLAAICYGVWKFTMPDSQPSNTSTKQFMDKQYSYQLAGNVKMLRLGAYVKKDNSNYYNFLIFESATVCRKVTIHKSKEESPGGIIFLQLIKTCMTIPGNTGRPTIDSEKNELQIRFNIDLEHEQYFRCKLRTDGTLSANVFYKDEHGQMQKDVREYYFDAEFCDKYIL